MTEEERQKIIQELEADVFGSKPKPKLTLQQKLEKQSAAKKAKKIKKCEVCDEELVDGECLDHPVYVRMHHNYLMRMRKLNEK